MLFVSVLSFLIPLKNPVKTVGRESRPSQISSAEGGSAYGGKNRPISMTGGTAFPPSAGFFSGILNTGVIPIFPQRQVAGT